MRIPMKVDYGVRALVELAMRYGAGPVPAAAIAQRQGIPEPYLERLMSALNKSGLVVSRRGPQGGHLLAQPPAHINLYDIMQLLDGNASPLDCLTLPTDCVFADSCAQQEIWQSVEDSIRQVLAATTLAHLAERQSALITAAASPAPESASPETEFVSESRRQTDYHPVADNAAYPHPHQRSHHHHPAGAGIG